VLGDMLEMGSEAASHHAALAEPIEAARADLVFLCGANMKALWDSLPASRRGAYAATSRELAAPLVEALRDGDTVLVKGSNGSKLSVIIDALKALGPA
jgi:UDP-N-acetylmuramoyl-tripeptide--D-alanyl-D-alanine ligase